ncbi:MAG: radical SAM protein [Victivallales bacterium]|nr:radical SAM protein [Victivallales bacterium]
MRCQLIFPPRTSPTYMPLGIAGLAATAAYYGHEIGLFDANAELWNHLCDTNRQLQAMRNFCHSPLAIFLQPQQYSTQMLPLNDGRYQIDQLERLARNYLEHDELDAALTPMLLRQAYRLNAGEPETVAFSIMYLDQLSFALALAKYLRRVCGYDRQLLFGGAAMSGLDPVELMTAFPFVDVVMTGEGEIPFAAWLGGAPVAAIPGCHYRERKEVIAASGRRQFVSNLGELPPPDFSHFPLRQYFNPVPVMPMLGGRGCKWRRCRFCTHNNSFGPYRERTAAAVAAEMTLRQQTTGCRHFYFADQYVDPSFLNSLSDTIIAAGLSCQFHIMARTVGDYTPELLHKAAAAGCCWISWGMESGSQRLLDIMNKGTDATTSLQVIRHAAEAGISNLLMMIFGAPGSDAAALDETFAFLDRAYPHIDSMTASAFVLFAGTAFSRAPQQYGLEILGKNRIFQVNGHDVHDLKLRFRRQGEYHRTESPLAAAEIAQWERRKVWLGHPSFLSRLCCEHYLLFARSVKTGFRPKGLPKGA